MNEPLPLEPLPPPVLGASEVVSRRLSAEHLEPVRRAELVLRERTDANPALDTCRAQGLECVSVLEALDLDAETLAAGLLLPLFEYGETDADVVEQRVGAGVARLLREAERISVLKELRHTAVEAAQADRLRRMLLTMAEDPRVVLVRLARQLCELRAAKRADDETRRRLGEETLDVFAPLASRLGVRQLKWELEDLSFRFVDPATYCELASQLNERRETRDAYVRRVLDLLMFELGRASIGSEVSGRPKHIYSIWKKMQRKSVGMEAIFDTIGFRVVVDEVADCYAALGLIHSLWAPVPSEFDDYIARPKANRYQSLHTAVVGPEGRTMEIQIRTHAMHRHAELGVAAHWHYKERKADFSAWSRRLLERVESDEPGSDNDLFERFRHIAFHDRIYVLTPQGRIIDLPIGATALDFAYAVHTAVGHQCRGAKSGGTILPLAQALVSGSTVEILTGREGGPSRDWLNPALGYLKTASARAKVRRWFRERDRAEHVVQGRAALDRELKRLGLDAVNTTELARTLHLADADELFAALGRGDLTPAQIAQALQPARPAPPGPTQTPAAPQAAGEARGEIIVLGVSDVMTRTARCCSPVPGEPIGGYITVGQGVSIHRATCRNLEKLIRERPERVVEVSWGESPGANHPVSIDLEANDRRGLLRDVSDMLSNQKVDIVAVKSYSDARSGKAHMIFTVLVADVRQLERIIHRLKRIKDVLHARRRA
ncbi:MAG: bifunctional (p)ppGpp synthetase/guanosine-3',5'-bis(diphosphate) 3'-pyrophosphohydrolase [Gammaproteobacteria bacterium]|nr:bifunctional (p)ppGpp synthetase/guanosine-3',5'-bis(diphosphate) 3'-pyrophosphohydrolase [Gammaproteobacteria bacterium]